MMESVRCAARRILVLLLLAVLSGARPARADEKADALGRELIAALGGEAAWEKARQFQFDFVVEQRGARRSPASRTSGIDTPATTGWPARTRPTRRSPSTST